MKGTFVIEAVKPRSDLIDEVYASIRNAIVFGAVRPEQALAQEVLAAQLGVSRQPVSHALALLRRDGLVVERGRRGLMVAPVDPDRILQLYQVRGALDALAAELAAARIGSGVVSGAERVALEQIIAAGRRAVEQGEIRALVEADVSFHRCVYGLSGNPAIGETAAGGWIHVQRSMGVVLADPGYRVRAWDEHATILDAMFAGDVSAARDRARAHAEEAGRHTFRRLMQQRQVA